jgi:acyl-CoA reductase-like NAD-dependent aldehyde dehydrogenase
MTTCGDLASSVPAFGPGLAVVEYEELLIGGRWRAPSGSTRLDVRFPHDQTLISTVPAAEILDVDEAVGAARLRRRSLATDDARWASQRC